MNGAALESASFRWPRRCERMIFIDERTIGTLLILAAGAGLYLRMGSKEKRRREMYLLERLREHEIDQSYGKGPRRQEPRLRPLKESNEQRAKSQSEGSATDPQGPLQPPHLRNPDGESD